MPEPLTNLEPCWVCPACGRTGTDRYRMGDTACSMWAVWCRPATPEERASLGVAWMRVTEDDDE